MSTQPRHPKDLTAEQLVTLVAIIQDILWADYETDDNGIIQGSDYWDPSKEWDTETVELIAAALDHHGLAPTEMANIDPNWVWE